MISDTDIKDLYQEVIVDHSHHPRNAKKLDHPTCSAQGYNPLCGDQLTLYLDVDGERIKDASFEGKGCAISIASASMMTEFLKNKTKSEALTQFQRFHRLITQEQPVPTGDEIELLGKLRVFSGVSEFPSRVKCASLAWHSLVSALTKGGAAVSTEVEE